MKSIINESKEDAKLAMDYLGESIIIDGRKGNKIKAKLTGINLFNNPPILFRFAVSVGEPPMASDHFIVHEIFVEEGGNNKPEEAR